MSKIHLDIQSLETQNLKYCRLKNEVEWTDTSQVYASHSPPCISHHSLLFYCKYQG